MRSVSFSVRKSLPSVIKQVECEEARLTTMKEQIAELRLAALIQTDDFAIQHCLACIWRFQLFAQVSNDLKELPLREMSSVRPFWMTASERKPSYFNSNIHSGWSKGRGLRDNGMGWNAMGRENSRPNGERWAKLLVIGRFSVRVGSHRLFDK